MAVAEGVAFLQLGSFIFTPPYVNYELISWKGRYSGQKSTCGSVLEAIDAVFNVYISGFCTMAESQAIQAQISTELAKSPNLRLTYRATPDAITQVNVVQSGELDQDPANLRAMFTGNNTLALVLTLSLVPDGQGGLGNAGFAALKQLAAAGGFNWTSDTIKMLLFGESSSIPDQLDAEVLAEFVTLSEADGAGYVRTAVSGRSVWPTPYGVTLVAADMNFGTVAAGSEDIVGGVIFKDLGDDDNNVPLFLVQSFAPITSGSVRIPLNLAGLF